MKRNICAIILGIVLVPNIMIASAKPTQEQTVKPTQEQLDKWNADAEQFLRAAHAMGGKHAIPVTQKITKTPETTATHKLAKL